MRIAAAPSLGMAVLALWFVGASASRAQAQGTAAGANAASEAARWRMSGEVGGVFGGTWLSGANAPRVSTDPGLALSVAVHRETSSRVSAGLALRGAMQGISMNEAGTKWSGGTATDAQLLGTLAYSLQRSGRLLSDLEFGAGMAFIAGTREVFPFSDVSQVAPSGEVALAFSPGEVSESLYRYRHFSLVVRYGVLRVDALGGDANLPNSMTAGAGWVGRTTIALRYRP